MSGSGVRPYILSRSGGGDGRVHEQHPGRLHAVHHYRRRRQGARDQAVARRASKHPFEIRVRPNRGRDIAPMLVGFRDRLREVTYGVHIHSKKSRHYPQAFEAWRRYLMTANLGSEITVRNILHLLSLPGVGAYLPDHHPEIVQLLQWGGILRYLYCWRKRWGEWDRDQVLDFPSGSMFWFRTSALRRLMDLELREVHFDPEVGQIDGTLAHAIERSFLFFVEASGFGWIVGRSVSGEEAQGAVAKFGGGGIWRLINRYFPMSRDLGRSGVIFPSAPIFCSVRARSRSRGSIFWFRRWRRGRPMPGWRRRWIFLRRFGAR